jgi:Fic family protein
LLKALVSEGRLERSGAGPATRYTPGSAGAVASRASSPAVAFTLAPAPRQTADAATPGHAWSPAARALIGKVTAPLGTRRPVSYSRSFVADYVPNHSSLLPAPLAPELSDSGRSKEQQPAGTYARKVLEQLLIDLSWFSSRLEGNRKSLLDTRELFEKGRSPGDDRDATMLLNHKEAIEFLVDAVPSEGMSVPVVRNLQSVLMRDLLVDTADLGAIRSRIVAIQDTVYTPNHVPDVLETTLDAIVDKARNTRNAVEAAFFLWVNIAYLQPFVDGNKRTSRLAANMPLMLANCAPLSFLDVEQHDYALAMLGVYERLDVTAAVELFEWTYRRSIQKYQVMVDSMERPDPIRTRYRESLNDVLRLVVYEGKRLRTVLAAARVDEADRAAFERMVNAELDALQTFNCARFRLPMGKTQEWIEAGRRR